MMKTDPWISLLLRVFDQRTFFDALCHKAGFGDPVGEYSPEDVVYQTVEKIIERGNRPRNLDLGNEQSAQEVVKAWLTDAVSNTRKDFWSKRCARQSREERYCESMQDGGGNSAEEPSHFDPENQSGLLLQRLNSNERQIVEMLQCDSKISAETIGEKLGMSADAVRQAQVRIRDKIGAIIRVWLTQGTTADEIAEKINLPKGEVLHALGAICQRDDEREKRKKKKLPPEKGQEHE